MRKYVEPVSYLRVGIRAFIVLESILFGGAALVWYRMKTNDGMSQYSKEANLLNFKVKRAEIMDKEPISSVGDHSL